MNKRTGAAIAALVLAAQAQADGEHYGQALGAYKSDLNKEPPSLINGGYIGDRAVSAAHRRVARAGDGVSRSGNGDDGGDGGNVNIGSPQINGSVHGDVTVVVQRGAIRGGVTSVRR